MNLRLYFTAILSLCFELTTAQSTISSTNNTNNVIIPPPPNVASFLKEADVPVSNYNGNASISIPLYTLIAGDLRIPISISYYNNGLKVTEEASWVGFGWNLNAGGVIHQNIVGNPDQLLSGGQYPSDPPLPIDMPPNGNVISWPNTFAHGCTFVDYNFNQQSFTPSQLIDDGSRFTGGNHEYDLFMYNFGGYSGKFIFPNYPTTGPVNLDKNNIKFNFDGINFTAITPDGTQYLFTTIGTTTSPGSSCFVSVQQPPIVSRSWYLTKIISPDENVATFTYTTYTSNSLPILSQSYSETRIGGVGDYPASQGFYKDFDFAFTGGSVSNNDNTTYSSSQVQNMVLSSITTANAVIKFNTSPREDVDQGLKLDNFSVYTAGGTALIKTVNFSYSYFMGSPSFGDWVTDPNVVLGCLNETSLGLTPPAVALRSERLKLNMLQLQGNGSAYVPPYQFIYDSSPMPYKTSMAEDLWGYFNGYDNSSLLPNYNNIGYFDNNLPIQLITSDFTGKKVLGIRKANPAYLQTGILKQIINPTGGYTKITYEPNQYANLPLTNNQIVDTVVNVRDFSPGKQQLIFTVPDVGYQGNAYINGSQVITSVNPATLNIWLTNPTGACSVTPGFNGYNFNNPSSPDNANALYALLETYDPVNKTGSVSQNNIFDFESNLWQNPVCSGSGNTVYMSTLPEQLVPGTYRITANYPDDEQGGLPQPSAAISVAYKYISSKSFSNYGGGLRIKSITDYTDANHISNQKIFTYYGGRLMTKPIFFRNALSFDAENRAVCSPIEPTADMGAVWALCGTSVNFPNAPESTLPLELPVASLSLYSNPLLNYSYAATGAAVGYDSVKIDYSADQKIGQSVYAYTNVSDAVTYYPEMLPGISGGNNLLNGTLIYSRELRKNADGTLSKLKEEDDSWIVNNFQDYWSYKTEYSPPYYGGCSGYNGSGPATQAEGQSLYYNYLHFYPVKTGKVLLQNKTETFYDSPHPYSVYTAYRYNGQNQLSATTTTKSDGRNEIKQTYYPGDYASTGVLGTMQSKNMIDYPIEVINNVSNSNNTSSTLTSAATYKQYYVHDNNIVSPQGIYVFNSPAPVAIVPSAPGGTVDSHYELRESYVYDQYGNEVTEQKAGGPLTHYLWDYNHLEPVAKVDNTSSTDFAYTSFEADATGNWQYSGAATADNTSPTGKYCYNLSNGNITNNSLISSKTYIVSYWTKNTTPFTIAGTQTGYPVQVRTLNGWYNFQHQVTGVTGVTISGTGFMDELRLYPSDAQMETYTYEPLIGTSTATDAKGNSTYYSYDPLQNLQYIKDLHGDIVKMFAYHYAGYNGLTFTNTALSQTFTRNNCSPGYAGSAVTYTVPAGAYTSYVSQEAANDLAQSDINDNGQNNANANTGCAIAPCSVGTITSVSVSGTSYTMTYTQSVGTSVIVRIYDTSGNQDAPPQGSLSLNGGTISGIVPAAGKVYTFDLWVYGSECPNGVMATPITVSF